MEPDCSGWATRAGVKCSDGRVILEDAFKHQDNMTVPLVWQHSHNDPGNVLGHAILSNRKGGVWAECFFNSSDNGAKSKHLVTHGDVTHFSIWANQLVEKAGRVMHGVIREVSLVLSGANPGAKIENVTIRHSDDTVTEYEDEVIIYTEEEIALGHADPEDKPDGGSGDESGDKPDENEDGVQARYESMSDKQKQLVHSAVEAILEGKDLNEVLHAGSGDISGQDVYDSMNDDQKQLVHWLIGQALESAGSGDATHGDVVDDAAENGDENEKGEPQMGDGVIKHNVFESGADGEKPNAFVLEHDAMVGILEDAKTRGSLKAAVQAYAREHLEHGITDIDILFPDAVATTNTPQFDQRRTAWVSAFMGACTKVPFSRIKTIVADITFEDARAKGYVKGTLKKEEFFGLTHRTTTPTTIYKKQALDRDDVVDITDFDVVAWLKAEMRLMLDEEVARAGLIGDGRAVDHEDKINETHIRPIATDSELFATTIYVNIDDASSSINEVIEAVIRNRKLYKGSGTPTLFTSESYISMFLLMKDSLGRRIYRSLDEVATDLRVSAIVPVEIMDEDDTLVGIIVNPVDYTWGATAGGQVSMFDDFDIDYNKQKYLIETRLCGALTRIKSALVLRKTASSDVLVTPTAPTFDPSNGHLTIHDTAHVVYKRTDTSATVTNGGSPYTVGSGASLTIEATPATGYFFEVNEDTDWTFTSEDY